MLRNISLRAVYRQLISVLSFWPVLCCCQDLTIQVVRGSEITPYLRTIADLRIKVFSEYPYLYDGDLKTENEYLNMYREKEGTLLVAAKDHGNVIGLILGTPYKELPDDYQQPFVKKSIKTDPIYYLGDIILLKEYRGKGIGQQLYEVFEKEVRSAKKYEAIAMCELITHSSDAKRPRDYHSLDPFWRKRKYSRHFDIVISAPWNEVGEVGEKDHLLTFSIKSLKDVVK